MARIELQILCICLPLICCLGAPLEQQLSPNEVYIGDGYFYLPPPSGQNDVPINSMRRFDFTRGNANDFHQRNANSVRNAFGALIKRNFDEIDNSGFGGFGR